MTLDEFIQNSNRFPNNAWVEEDGFSGLYVRKTQRYLNNQLCETLDLANIQAKKPGSGAFTKLIARLLNTYPNIVLYVENVVDPDRFGKKLIELGFTRIESDYFNSYWKGNIQWTPNSK